MTGQGKTTGSLQPAWVLHQRDYRESSRIVELFTREHGRLAVVARGARGPKARLRGLLQPFHPVLVSWVARGELGTLTGCEASGPPLGPMRDNQMSGFYLNELVLRLVRVHDPHPTLFDAYGEVIATLAAGNAAAPALRLFEKRLLDALGYGLSLTHDADTGQPVEADARYDYLPERGLVRQGTGAGPGFAGRSMAALARDDFSDAQVLSDSRRLLRVVLDFYLDGRPLKVRDVARALRK